jgi:N-methylhydantoinase A
MPGPVIVEEYDSSTVVPPGCQVGIDTWGNIVVDLPPERANA